MVAASLTLADPIPMTAPDHRTSVTITGLDTWFWVEGLRATDATVDVGGLGVTVSARPTSTTWTIQDHVVRCDSLGLPYSPMRDAPCGYVFQHISPPGGHAVQVAVRWTRTWKASDGRTGLLPDTTTAASFDLVVEQIQVTTD